MLMVFVFVLQLALVSGPSGDKLTYIQCIGQKLMLGCCRTFS